MIKKLAISAAMLGAAFACAEEKIGDIVKAGDTTYMLVCELSTPEQNANFQRNLNIMQSDSRAIDILKNAVAKEADAAKKASLEEKLKTLETNFSSNDEAMQKAYRFATSRKYRMIFLESNICVPLSNEELSTLKDSDGNALDPMKILTRGGKSLYVKKTVSGSDENQKLQRMIGFVVARRADLDNMRKKLAETTDPAAQLEITAKLGAGEKALAEAEDKLRTEYGIKAKSDYVIETSKSKMYLILTPEEILKIEAQNKRQK